MILIDTSAWCALFHRRDSHHKAAAAFWKQCLDMQTAMLSTYDVFDETLTLLLKRVDHAAALQFGDAFRSSRHLIRVEIESNLREDAWQLFRRFKDQDFSFTDCTSFAVMHARKVRQVFTFDSDFRKAGFEVVP